MLERCFALMACGIFLDSLTQASSPKEASACSHLKKRLKKIYDRDRKKLILAILLDKQYEKACSRAYPFENDV
jgi:hypothetical protein